MADRVRVTTKERTYEGIQMPDEANALVLKLDSGYNLGIDKKRVTAVTVIEKAAEKKAVADKVVQKTGLPKITILHTGGTIASKVDYETGGVISKFTPEEILGLFPELRDIANIDSRLVRNMASDDMRFAHYNILAEAVAEEVKKGVKGVIITHGTDTLHYTSAALSFALAHCPIPVILVGSQRSSDRGSSDAATNLISAAIFIVQSDFCGVGVCMHETMNDTSCVILPGVACRKLHSTRRDAFKSINVAPWARVDPAKRTITVLRPGPHKSHVTFTVKPFKPNLKVGLLTVHTNMYAEEFKTYDGWDGLVLAGTGLGHAPISEIDNETKEHPKILAVIQKLVSSGTLVAMSTQTIFGQVDMNVYAPGRKLISAGVLGNLTAMTPETAFIKLAWLLSNYSKEEAKKLYATDFAGELPERLEAAGSVND